uniref:NADH-ubiquinone oxidoreductase chain 4L n=1 Tax=Pilsbryoconcha exilis TaxID=178825 RepID=A0A513X0I5_9BIVA|nr:NADH dehydrogenase subunit 4L [Pilsbryoconcha exilis]
MGLSICWQYVVMVIMMVLGVMCVMFQRHSLLGILLGLEILSVIMYFSCTVVFMTMHKSVALGLTFLCLEVCVMSVCLALMVKSVKAVGSDYVGVSFLSKNF